LYVQVVKAAGTGGVFIEGNLEMKIKKGESMMQMFAMGDDDEWQTRLIKIRRSLRLEYFEVQSADMKGQRSVSKLGSYDLSDLKDIVSGYNEVEFGFQLVTKQDDDTISFKVKGEAEKMKWLFAFEEGHRMATSRK
jgi:hypothetical protein